ncbi:Bacterial regulatory protein, arsR family [anaerobic digester metagenome]
MRKLLWWVIAGTTGGPNRAKIIKELHERPYNAHQLAERLELNYKTVRHHLKVLDENNLITSSGKKYGELYFLSDKIIENYDVFEDIWKELKYGSEEEQPQNP